MTIALTVLFSLPAAVVIGNFQREILEGHIDMLSTLPNITALHSLLAWCVASWYWLMALSFCTVLFFHGIFQYCNPLLPSLALCLLGISLGPVAALFSKVISKPDTLVLSIPIFSFIMLLPGIIYYDLAFDIQRSTWKEMVLCLFPPSAMAMILRLCFSNEAIGVGVSWLHRAPVSNTTVSWYLLMLVIDSILYMCLASLLFRKKLFQQDQSWPILCCSKSSKENAENEQSCWILFRQFQEDMSRWFGNQSYEYISNSKNSSPFKMRASLDSNDSVPRRKPFLQVHNVSKSYQSSGVAVPVLSDIDTQLDSDTITVLLGSNGAGKTTFMKIIAGLDPKYRGSIKTPFQGNDSDRVIGWCPQNDAIFDLLTVQEHMELYTDLLCIKQQNYFFSYGDKSQFISRQLEKLGMLEHASKTVMGLSGGMKRRLTLALSFLGDPKILLLEEPTSGCDSWTRELVRKDVLSRKKHRTILISTHHSDDIEVLADRVWFLNERSLEIDEEVDVLVNKTAAISEFEDLSSKTAQSGDRPLKFICKCEEVDHLFRQYFGETNSKLWQHVGVESHSPAAGLPLERQYILPIHKVERLQGLLQLLDQQQLLHWSLETCTVFEALCNLYADAPSITGSSNFADVNNSRTASPQSSTTMQDLERGGYGSTFMRQVRSILWMRSLEIRKNSFAFFSTNVLIPFLVVLALCYGCRDAQYPKVEITSNNLDGIGEICMASGRQLSSQNQPLSVAFQHSSPSSIFHKIATPENKDNDALEDTLNSTQSIAGLITNMIPTSSVDWRGKENSNKLWSELLQEYFQHDSQRWGAIVLDDVDNNWIESTIILDESDMKLAPRKAFEELQSMHDELCGNSSTSPWSHVKNEESVKHLLASELTFCDSNPALSIKLNRNSSSDQDDQGWYLAVKSHQEMRSNFTLLSNVTSDHAAPVFLKEVLTPVHDAIWGSAMLHNANGTDRNQKVIETPIYRLFSFPLPESNIINRRFIERGYLGSMMIVMYLMITSVSSVRFVAKLRACKVKRQLHLSGLSIPTYWIANAMADTILIIVSLFSIFLAIAIGGEPVKSFFWNFPPFSGCLFLFALFIFAHAIVAANFALVVLSEDQLASQLFVLITTLSGGVFFKMYLDRQHGVLYESISNIFIMFSPTFAFSTIMFDMFSIYTHSITAAIRSNSLQNGVDERFLRIVHCLVMMLLQTLVYLSICIAVDEYIVRVLHGIQQLRWYFAAQNMSHFSSHQKSTTVNVEETSSLLQEEDRIEQSLTKAAGDRMIRLLSLHPHFRVGIFPIINSNNYQEAYSSQLPQSEMSCNMRLASNDIEMEPIHPQHNHHNHSRYLYESSGNNRHVKALQAIDVCVGYPDQDRLSLCNLNVSIAAGEKIAVMGMNGGGKTTFFETCALASKIPMHGKLLINGHEVVSDQDKIINSKCLGYVPQEDGLLDFCTVQQCLELFSNMQGRSLQDEFDFHGENIDGFLPTKFLHYPTHALSGGTKKKLLVRLSNIGKPNVLLMDECTTGVDPIAAEKIIEYLKANITDQSKAMKEQSLIFSSHRIDESFAICDKVLMLVDGQVYIDGPSSIFIDLMTSYYQVDILLTPTSTNEDLFHIVEQYFGSLQLLERVVVYNDRLLRLTLHKQRVPVSRWWSALLTWQHNQVVACFYFRTMEMEEILATILSTTSNNSMTL